MERFKVVTCTTTACGILSLMGSAKRPSTSCRPKAENQLYYTLSSDSSPSIGSFYHMLNLNPNAADQIGFMMDILATANNPLITIERGSSALIEALHSKLDLSRVDIMMNTAVISFSEMDDGMISVITTAGDFTGHHVIFTCQQRAYATIQGFSLDVRALIGSVVPLELFKIFVVIENPPFDEQTLPHANYRVDRVPCREIHYGYDPFSKTGVVMIYGDMPYVNYWTPFLKGASPLPQNNSNDHLRNHISHYLRRIFDDEQAVPFSVVHYGIMDWSKEPYGAGCHLWRPGAVSFEVMRSLKAFGAHKTVHICGETFSNYQGFIEGCLRSVDATLETVIPRQ